MLALSWWNRPATSRYDAVICDGAVRSGKTVCMTDGFFLWSMSHFHRQSFALCGRSISTLRRNIVCHLENWLGPVFKISDNLSRNVLTVRCGSRVNTYYLFGGENESSYKSIQGITLAGVLLDEAVLMPRSFVEQAVARCSVPGSKLWFNCNPAGPEHWFYKEWILKAKEKNLLRIHFTMEDNPSLDQKIRNRYQRMYTGVFYRRYILGQWCVAEGLVYDFDREKHTVSQLPAGGRYYISVDYGTMNPFSAGLWVVSGGIATRIAEYWHSGRLSGRMLTDQDYYDAIEQLAGDRPIEKVVVDPSAASFIALIRKNGRFSVRKARNDVVSGIRLVASLLQQGRVKIAENCENAIREFGLYSWEPEQDRPRKEDDHAMDEIRYFCATVLKG